MDLRINGQTRRIEADPDMPLLWALRDVLGLTGTKYGCGAAACGACTVHLDGQAVLACQTLIGDVEGKTAVIIDDIVDTAGSLCEGARALEKRGAKRIFASCSHAILSDPAVQRINESPIEKLVITDTIPLPPEKQSDKFVVLSLADALGDVMMRIQSHRSVSQLF